MQSQEEAIKKVTGPCIILAGAGTGKTHTIVEKIKYIISNKIYEPEKVLCLTFSNEAANSLKNRVAPYIKDREPIIRTFHSFCADFLRLYGTKISVKETFKILLPDDAKIMLHKNFKLNPRLCVKYVDSLGLAKDLGISLEIMEKYLVDKLSKLKYDDLEKRAEILQFELNTSYLKKSQSKSLLKEEMNALTNLIQIKKFVQAWRAYEKIKNRSNFLDYGDLNMKALELVKIFPDLKNSFDYIIVDEFQDTNKQQLELLKILSGKNNITIVGDINQSIYQFRGAYKDIFSEFKEHFKVEQKDIINLEKSFRSPNTVLRTAHKLIENNYARKEECFQVLNANNIEGKNVQVIEVKNEKEESRKILEIIKEYPENSLENVCVMFRTHQQARQLKILLDMNKIPYSSITKRSLLNLAYIKNIINYLTIAHKLNAKTQGGERAWWSIINSLELEKDDRDICNKNIRKNSNDQCISSRLFTDLQEIKVSDISKTKISELMQLLNVLLENVSKPVPDLIKLISEKNNIDDSNAQKNIDKLVEFAAEQTKDGGDLGSFIYHLEIMEKIGIQLDSISPEIKGVRIMTNHSTKGLEYGTVICSAFSQGKFPSERIKKDNLIPQELLPEIKNILLDTPPYAQEEIISEFEEKAQLAEERRLCYVAFTRTKENLIITYAQQYGNKKLAPSQFLKEIDYKNNPDIKFSEDLEEKYSSLINQNSPKALESTIPKRVTFSPSALLLFTECQKKYEYKYIHSMPEKEPASWEEIMLGSFVHEVMEHGVKANYKTENEFIELALSKAENDEWRSINLRDALPIIRVFFERNRNKYNSESLTETKLRVNIDGLSFEGYADRIDIHPDGIEIIDYKTGKSYITAKHRNWQLGLYALAAASLNLGPVKYLTLDMLRHEKPYEFEVLSNGLARDKNSRQIAFNLEQVKSELIATAEEIIECYKKGFKSCSIEQNCEFCNEHIWKT
jgi:DNA helicase-2/ATP-dependent DNA helicase PcrA